MFLPPESPRKGKNVIYFFRHTRILTGEVQCLFHVIINIICIKILCYFNTGNFSGVKNKTADAKKKGASLHTLIRIPSKPGKNATVDFGHSEVLFTDEKSSWTFLILCLTFRGSYFVNFFLNFLIEEEPWSWPFLKLFWNLPILIFFH